jgi:hypothetical protein
MCLCIPRYKRNSECLREQHVQDRRGEVADGWTKYNYEELHKKSLGRSDQGERNGRDM